MSKSVFDAVNNIGDRVLDHRSNDGIEMTMFSYAGSIFDCVIVAGKVRWFKNIKTDEQILAVDSSRLKAVGKIIDMA